MKNQKGEGGLVHGKISQVVGSIQSSSIQILGM